MIPLLSRSVRKFRGGRGSDSLWQAQNVGVRGALEKRQSRDTRKEHKSIPAFKIDSNPMPITGSSRLAYSNILQAACRAEALEFKRANLSRCLNK